jgi:hypothetical protein
MEEGIIKGESVSLDATKVSAYIKEFNADAGYDRNKTRLTIIESLYATPYITINPRNCREIQKKRRWFAVRSCRKSSIKRTSFMNTR